uniref:Uncharacterized protein n=1 Tax=Leersia perrieri TaxID=77586 RepID=A0A0D9VKA0_9ORYZ
MAGATAAVAALVGAGAGASPAANATVAEAATRTAQAIFFISIPFLPLKVARPNRRSIDGTEARKKEMALLLLLLLMLCFLPQEGEETRRMAGFIAGLVG